MTITRLLVARHGETVDNAAGVWQGWGDSALSARGVAQAAALSERLAAEPIAAVYSSDLGRAIETARIAAGAHGLGVVEMAALRERDVGLFSGLSGPEVEHRFPEAISQRRASGPLDWAPPEGESFRQMLERILPAIDAIARAWAGRTVLIVTHGGVIRLLAAQAMSGDWDHIYERHPSNCGFSLFRRLSSGTLELEQFDACEHLHEGEGSVAPLSEDA